MVLVGGCAGTGSDGAPGQPTGARPVSRAEAIAEMEANSARADRGNKNVRYPDHVPSTPTDEAPFVGSRLRLVSNWVIARTFDDVRSTGYEDLGQAHVLLFRRPSMHGRRPTAIAETMQITKQSVNELLGHLEDRGYLTRGWILRIAGPASCASPGGAAPSSAP